MNLNYEPTYKIRPLKWELSSANWQTASTVFGSIRIEHEHGQWKWSYCFDEYYDEDSFLCDSEKEAKQKAEEFYLSKLKDALIEL